MRDLTLLHRGLDMAALAQVFAGEPVTMEDTRQDYGGPVSPPWSCLKAAWW
jgi:hypothetical protein